MSSNGSYRAQLEAQRRRQLQLEQLTNECRGLLAACETSIQTITAPALQQVIARDLQAIQGEITRLAGQVAANPEQTKIQIGAMQKRLNALITDGQARVHQWSREQAEAQARLQQLRQGLTAQNQSAHPAARPHTSVIFGARSRGDS